MVDSIKPTIGTIATKKNPYRSTSATQAVESHSDEKQPSPPQWDRRERRSGRDRRHNTKGKRREFEMRLNPGRRKSDRPHPTIETKA